MSRTQQAIQWLNAAPGRTQQQAAIAYGISQAAISAALCRARGKPDKVRMERAACAALAEIMGAPRVADAIRKRGRA